MLNKKVSIYVPSTMHDAAAPDHIVNYYVNDTLKKLSVLFGGATIQPARSSWYSNELDRLISEDIYICYSYCESYNRDDLVAICENLKTVFMQESVSLELSDAGLMFV